MRRPSSVGFKIDRSFDAAFFAEITGGNPIQRELQHAVHKLFRAMQVVDVLPPNVPHRSRWLTLWQDAHDALLTRMAGAATGSALPTMSAAEALAEVAVNLFAQKWGTILGEAQELDCSVADTHRWRRLMQGLWRGVKSPPVPIQTDVHSDETILVEGIRCAWDVVVMAKIHHRPVEPAFRGLRDALRPVQALVWQQVLNSCEALDAVLLAPPAASPREMHEGVNGIP